MGVLLLLISMPDTLEVYPASVFLFFGGYFVLYECGAGGGFFWGGFQMSCLAAVIMSLVSAAGHLRRRLR